jgi:glycine oxidase
LANYDVLIIGGGVIGLSLARELHRLGPRRIAVVERGRVGREASFAAAGMLAPNAENEAIDDFYRLCDESRSLFPQLAEELLAETGIDIELDRSGTIYAAFTEKDSTHLDSRYVRQIEAGIPVERFSANQTREAEPYLAENVRESLYFRNDWQVENRKLLAALRSYAAANGIELIESSEADSLLVEDSKVLGAAVREQRIFAGTTLLATGAWTSLIKIGDGPVPFSVKPIRGQMISFAPPDRFFQRVIYSPRGYLVPRADGRILAGATVEDVGFDDSITPEATEFLRATAIEIAPLLNGIPIAETWAGLRPFAADGLPVIGPVPGYENLFAATAHFRNGILLAPMTAKILAEKIVNGSDSKYFDLFGIDRLVEKGFNANAS